MAQTLNTYDFVCLDCLGEFKVERPPAELAKGDGDLIECPNCFTEFEWDYDEDTDTLELTPIDDDEEAEDMDLTCTDDFEEDDED